MFKRINSQSQSGNAAIVVLVILVVVAIGGLAYMSSSGKLDFGGSSAAPQASASAEEPAAGETDVAEAGADAPADAQPPANPDVQPGNPVVATVDGEDVTRLDVFEYIQTLPAQTQQMPPLQLFPLALEQVINAKIIEDKAKSAKGLEKDPEFKRQLELAKEQIGKTVYLQNQIDERLTEERLKEAYDQTVAATPTGTEVRAAHILVEDEETAKTVIAKLVESGDFAGLAKEYSKDTATADKGGDIGYFLKEDVVPEFAEAAFSLEPGVYTKDPVKSEFGYHIIKVDDKRERQPPTMEQAEPYLRGQLSRQVLDEIVQEWKAEAKVEKFDINGEPLESAEPAAGGDAPAEAPADAPAP